MGSVVLFIIIFLQSLIIGFLLYRLTRFDGRIVTADKPDGEGELWVFDFNPDEIRKKKSARLKIVDHVSQ